MVLLGGADGGEVVEEWTLLLLAAPARGYPGDGEHAGDELIAGLGFGAEALFAPEGVRARRQRDRASEKSVADVLVRHTRQHIDQMNATVFAAD
ncbi:MAG: hypothetical protein M1396_04130 [Chloroflexi bacterium]|nr:hypothetical protein [Chloroflexota bacterium]